MFGSIAPLLTDTPLAGVAAMVQRYFGPTVRYAVAPTPYGQALVAIAEGDLSALVLGQDDEDVVRQLRRRYPGATEAKGDLAFWYSGVDVFQAIEAVELPAGLESDSRQDAFERAVRVQLTKQPGQPLRRITH